MTKIWGVKNIQGVNDVGTGVQCGLGWELGWVGLALLYEVSTQGLSLDVIRMPGRNDNTASAVSLCEKY